MPYRLSCTHASAGAVTNFIKQTPHLILRQSQCLLFAPPHKKAKACGLADGRNVLLPMQIFSCFGCTYYTNSTKRVKTFSNFSAQILHCLHKFQTFLRTSYIREHFQNRWRFYLMPSRFFCVNQALSSFLVIHINPFCCVWCPFIIINIRGNAPIFRKEEH